MFAVHKTEVILPERARAAILATLTFNLIIKISNSGVAYTCACVYFVQGCSEKPKQGFCWNWESELGGGRGKRKKKKNNYPEPCIYSKAFQSVCTSSSLQ